MEVSDVGGVIIVMAGVSFDDEWIYQLRWAGEHEISDDGGVSDGWCLLINECMG